MPIFSGSSNIVDVRSGSTQVKKVYSGANLVWAAVPNINYAPNSWTEAIAGATWARQLVGSGAPNFAIGGWSTNSKIQPAHRYWSSGSFFTTNTEFFAASVPGMFAGEDYQLTINVPTGSHSFAGGSGTGGANLRVIIRDVTNNTPINGLSGTTVAISSVGFPASGVDPTYSFGVTAIPFTVPVGCTEISVRLGIVGYTNTSREIIFDVTEVYLELV